MLVNTPEVLVYGSSGVAQWVAALDAEMAGHDRKGALDSLQDWRSGMKFNFDFAGKKRKNLKILEDIVYR